jgi:hypothetical protein
MFLGAWGGGIWTYGPEVRRTDGRLPCPLEAGPSFRLVWEAEAWVHGWLGCATSAERRVRIREAEYPPNRVNDLAIAAAGLGSTEPVAWDLRAYWTEDEEPGWFRISETSWTSHRKGDLPWPQSPVEMLDGSVQRFEGGVMLRLHRMQGADSTLVLLGRDSRGSWRELHDVAPARAVQATPATLPSRTAP